MIRRFELGLLRSVRFSTRKSAYKLFMGGSFAAMALLNTPSAACGAESGKDNDSSKSSASYFGFFSNRKGSKNEGDDGNPDPIAAWIDHHMPTIQQLGFGGMMGICTGIAVKRIGNGAAATIGVAFMCLQGLSYLGYITIDYGKFHKDATSLLDADGDGSLTSKDAVALWNRFKDIVTFNLPSASGFSAGVLLGLWFGR